MAVKKTIAVITSTSEKAAAILNKLSLENYRLLLVSKSAGQFIELSKNIRRTQPNATLEIIDCMKDGCWEADIIILDISCSEEKEVATLIQDVATQKIVVNFSEDENDGLQYLLKYSKVVRAFDTNNSLEISLYGQDRDAVGEVSDIFRNQKKAESN